MKRGGFGSMKQNKYDDPAFFANYSQMARSIGGLDAAGEWPAFRALLPKLRDKNVLDLGCGFGWHCRYAREQQARSVVGVDLSEKMIARARESTNDSAIEYRQLAIEDIDFPAGEFDVVLSSLALHYVERFDQWASTYECRELESLLFLILDRCDQEKHRAASFVPHFGKLVQHFSRRLRFGELRNGETNVK